MNQTNNRIREEWREKLNKILWDNIDSDVINCERPMKKQLAPDLENFIDELLKSQRAELVEKIEKMDGINIENNDRTIRYLILKEKFLSLIKEEYYEKTMQNGIRARL